MSNCIKIKNLSKKYEKNKSISVLNDISFNFESGKVYSICFRSTLDDSESIISLDTYGA